jgi:multimeric flavodoxin WrbA
MKVTVILGSPKGMKGATGSLLESVLAGVNSVDEEIEIRPFILSELSVKFCRGCELCFKKGSCPLKDDFQTIKESMLEADGIILASPNYSYNVSAQMKVFCDRICSMIHCQMMFHKYSAVVTTGGGEYEPAEQYLLTLLEKMGCWQVGSVGANTIQLDDDDERNRMSLEAGELGVRLARAIQAQEYFPQQAEGLQAFFESMKALVTIQKDQWLHDYSYWQEHWGLIED